MSGFVERNVIMVDSTARSSGAASRDGVCGGELFGDEVIDEAPEVSAGGVVV